MRLLLLAGIVLVLSACTARAPREVDGQAQREIVAALTQWDFKGRMAVKVENDPDASGQLNIYWEQIDVASQIRLSGPFGAGAWEMLWEPERVTVNDADGERAIEYTGPDAAEDFMRDELGWSFPADSIRFWVRGLPDPSSDAVLQWGETGALDGLQQHDWDIAYERYGWFEQLLMPTRITMEGRGVRLRVVISKWQIATSSG